MPDVRGAALVILVLVITGALALVLAPFDAGMVRVRGVSILWWYVGLCGPVIAVVATAIALHSAGDAAAPTDERRSPNALGARVRDETGLGHSSR